MDNYEQKAFKKLNKIGKILIILPFVRCVILNGSLASGNFKASSDIDLLIIAKDGRIFTCRFFVIGLLQLFGLKRSKDESKPHAGKFCVNYFLTESFLKIPTGRGEKMDHYCAKNYSASVLIAGDEQLFKKFMQTNQVLFKKYGFQMFKPKFPISNKMPKSKFQRFSEVLFSDWIEKKLKKMQIRSIESDLRTKKYPELIIYDDRELRFHPPKKTKN